MVGFPLLLIPLAIYNIIAFLMREVSFATPLVTLPLPSGTGWPVTLSDVLLTLGILLLLCEVIKGARPGAKYLTDHLLSLLVLCGAAAEFAMLPQFGTSSFFLLTMMALVDFLSGIALRSRRGAQAPAAVVSGRGSRKAAVAPEPSFEPEPAQVQTIPLDKPEPTFVHPAPAPVGPAAEVASPRLQPGDGATPPQDAPPR